MVSKKYKFILPSILSVLSIYFFIQCTFFIEKPAHMLHYLFSSKMYGFLTSFSPYDLIPYFNIVFRAGLFISGLFFVFAAEPLIKSRVKGRRVISIPIAIVTTPFYFIFLYLTFYGIQALFK